MSKQGRPYYSAGWAWQAKNGVWCVTMIGPSGTRTTTSPYTDQAEAERAVAERLTWAFE